MTHFERMESDIARYRGAADIRHQMAGRGDGEMALVRAASAALHFARAARQQTLVLEQCRCRWPDGMPEANGSTHPMMAAGKHRRAGTHGNWTGD